MKIKATLLSLLGFLLLAAPAARAQFEITTNAGTITIDLYTGSGGAVSIPSMTNGLSVTSIGRGAFNTYDGSSSGVTSVTIPNSVTNLGSTTFGYCYDLTNVMIGNGLTTISDGAFFSCTSLAQIILSSNVSSIGTNAFAYCTSLSNVFFEGNAPLADPTAFVGDGDVFAVYYEHGTTGWGATFDGLQTLLWSPPFPFGYTIQGGTISIASYFGSGGAATIPSQIGALTVTSIGDAAFEGSSNLDSITIANTITSIGEDAFDDCYSLTNVSFGGGVASIGDYGFYGCPLLANVTIGNSVISIGDDAFAYCGLTNVNLGSRVTSIGDSAFLGCFGLTSVTFPSSVATIEDDAFDYCSNLFGLYFQGNEPVGSQDIEVYDFNLNFVYYLAGTTGWGAEFDGLPTVRWVPGSLQVTILPQGVVSAGAQWSLNGKEFQANGTIVSNLAFGSYTVQFSTIAGWATPADQTVIVASNSFALVSATYVPYTISVSASPGTGGTASVGGPIASDGTLTVVATANDGYTFSGWTENGTLASTEAIYTFVPGGNLDLVANFTAASGTPTQIFYQTLSDPAGSIGTYAYGIDGGNVIGYYLDSNYTAHGFLYANGAYTTLDDPHAGVGFDFGTYAQGISGSNIVGYYVDASENVHGFLYNGSSYTTLDAPNGSFTHATGIDGGNIVGYFDSYETAYGFLYANGGYTILSDPGAGGGNYDGTYARGVSAGQIVGFYADASGNNHGFLYNGNTWLALDDPNDDNGLYTTYPEGVQGGYMVGYCINHGFVYTNGSYVTMDVPGTAGTSAQGVSGSTIVGVYSEFSGAVHAFIATVVGGTAGGTPTEISYILTNGSITITGYTGAGAVASFPSSISNIPVTGIGYGTLFDSAVTNVIIPDSVTTIESNAIIQCDALTEITIPASVTNIGACPFYGCESLTTINVDTNNPAYISIGGVLFNKGGTTLVEYPEKISVESYSIPTTVTNIGAYAFYLCGSLGSVTIPASVTSVGEGAFYLCDDLGDVLFQGNAPAGDSTVFASDRLEYVFYCPGASGWGSTFGGVTANACSYCCSEPSGSLQVTITPAAAIAEGAKWQVDGGTNQNSGTTVTDLSVGTPLTVSFKSISGWNTPLDQMVTLTNNETTKAAGIYTQVAKGNPKLTITSPTSGQSVTGSNYDFSVTGTTTDKALVTNVLYQFNGGSWMSTTPGNSWSNWTASVTLVPGSNTLSAYAQDITGLNSPAITNKFKFFPSGALMVKTNGLGSITPVDNGKSLGLGTNYTLTASPGKNWIFSNWVAGGSGSFVSNNPVLTFKMQSNLVLQANFVTNPFIAIQGAYHGLFYQTNASSPVTEPSSGFATITISPGSKGAYSAVLKVDGGSYSFSGAFDLNGNSVTNVARKGKLPLALTLHIDLNLSPPEDYLTGSVEADDWDGPSGLLADLAYFNGATLKASNYAGKYTFVLPGSDTPATSPGGDSVAEFANTLAGNAVLTGSLADNTTISSLSTPISKEGFVPVYYSSTPGTNVIFGWLNFTNVPPQSVFGDLTWFKLPKSKVLYSNGFTLQSNILIGSLYAPVTTNTLVTDGTLAIVDLAQGINLVYTNVSIISNKLSYAKTTTNQLTATITPTTGALSLSFRPTGTKANLTAQGVVLQNSPADPSLKAAGWFLGANQTGYFLLTQ